MDFARILENDLTAMRAVLTLGALLAASALTGCAPHGPRMHPPNRIEPFCSGRVPQVSAILSVVTSAADRIESVPAPRAGDARRTLTALGGVIVHWNGQPLLLPAVAKELGYPDRYVTLVDAAIYNRKAGVDTRRMYLTVKLPAGGTKTFATRAFDVQDICNEGTRSV
ncbi:MAG: hypothetical protein ABR591_06060 [Candidatus Velthaea sp.]